MQLGIWQTWRPTHRALPVWREGSVRRRGTDAVGKGLEINASTARVVETLDNKLPAEHTIGVGRLDEIEAR